MAFSMQRLLSGSLWYAGRCSLCGHLRVRTSRLSSGPGVSLSALGSQQRQLSRAASGSRGRPDDSGKFQERYQGESEDTGGTKSFRGWGKFSKPSTWGTKSKKVWKSKQPSRPEEDEVDEVYPVRTSEPYMAKQQWGTDRDRRSRIPSHDRERLEARPKHPNESYQERHLGAQQYRDAENGAETVADGRVASRRAYPRSRNGDTGGNQQPWVKNETSQQVYSGLQKQVREAEDEGEPEGLSAARDLQWGQQIDFKVYQFTPLGMRVIIRGGYDGLVYNDQIELHGRERIQLGDIMKGYVFKIRDDDKVDVSLRAFGKTQYESDKAYLEEQLVLRGGFIPLNSRSPPEEIAADLKLSKSGFKKAVGGLMKMGRAIENEEGIVLVEAEKAGIVKRT